MSTLLDQLRENPEYTTLRLGGRDRGFLLSVYGCELATAAGHDPLPAVGEMLRRAPAGGDDAPAGLVGTLRQLALTTDGLSALSTLVWAGLLPFDEDLRSPDGLALVKASLTPGAVLGLVRTVLPRVLVFSRQSRDVSADTPAPDADDVDEDEDDPGN